MSVDPQLTDYISQAAAILYDATGVDLVIVSGYRSPADQAALRARFRRGDRAGIVAEPALDSLHVAGRAVDVQLRYMGQLVPVRETPMEYWRFLADLLAPVGVRWGGRFRKPDPNHFDL